MMKILGVDPGLRLTGYGLIQFKENTCRVMEAGVIRSDSKDFFQIRIQSIYVNLKNLIEEHQPQVMVLEKLYAHHRHPTTASLLGHVRGCICLLCAQYHLKLEEHSVKRIRKSITGSGTATSDQTKKMVSRYLNIDSKKLTPDSSDALALALGYIYTMKQKT